MNSLQTVATYVAPLWAIVGPLAPYIALFLGYQAVAELQRRGYSTTYANAILRAVGAGVATCKQLGLDPMTAQGRAAIASGGTNYLKSNLTTVISKLAIPDAEHGDKVLAQFDAMQAQAEADAKAAAVAATAGPAALITDALTQALQGALPLPAAAPVTK